MHDHDSSFDKCCKRIVLASDHQVSALGSAKGFDDVSINHMVEFSDVPIRISANNLDSTNERLTIRCLNGSCLTSRPRGALRYLSVRARVQVPKFINLSKRNDRLSGRGPMLSFDYRASVLGNIFELDVILSNMLCHISCVLTSMLIPIRIDADFRQGELVAAGSSF